MADSLAATIRESVPWLIKEPSSARLGWLRLQARGLRVDVRELQVEGRERVWHAKYPVAVHVDFDRQRPVESLLEIEHWAQRSAPTLVTASIESDLRDFHLLLMEAGAQDVMMGWDEPRRTLKLLSRFVKQHRTLPSDLWALVARRVQGDFR